MRALILLDRKTEVQYGNDNNVTAIGGRNDSFGGDISTDTFICIAPGTGGFIWTNV